MILRDQPERRRKKISLKSRIYYVLYIKARLNPLKSDDLHRVYGHLTKSAQVIPPYILRYNPR